MGENSAIQWTDHTMNPWIGCSKVSAECDNCYAESGSRRLGAQHGLKLWEDDRYFTGANYWSQPNAWNRRAEREGRRARVFCASYADVFEDRAELVERRKMLFNIIAETSSLDWLLLTKRPENIAHMLPSYRGAGGVGAMWPNIWLGTTVGVRSSLPRVDALLENRAVVRFVSYEPALEIVDFSRYLTTVEPITRFEAFTPEAKAAYPIAPKTLVRGGIDWLIVGGESGPRARPFDPVWARKAIADCAKSGAACFVKQLGRRILGSNEGFRLANRYLLPDGVEFVPPIIGVNAERRPDNAIGFTLFDTHGGDMREWPEDLRVRQFPEVRA